MKKIYISILLCALCANSVFADGGFWSADRSWITINSTEYRVYNNANVFSPKALGTFNVGDAVTISAYKANVWRNNGSNGNGNVTGLTFYYIVYPTGSRPTSPSFTSVSCPWISNNGDNQQWGFSGRSINVNSGSVGDYTLEFYAHISGDYLNGETYDSNGSGNYKATFTVIEPALAWVGAPTLNANLENHDPDFYGGSWIISDMSVGLFDDFSYNDGHYNVNCPPHADLYKFTNNNGDYTNFTKYFQLGGTAKTNIPAAQVFLKYRLWAVGTNARDDVSTGDNSIELLYNSGTGNWEVPANFDILEAANCNKEVFSYHPYDVEFWFESTYNGATIHYSNDGKNYWFRFDTSPFPIANPEISISVNGGETTQTESASNTNNDTFNDVTSFEVGGSCQIKDYRATMGVPEGQDADKVTTYLNYKFIQNSNQIGDIGSVTLPFVTYSEPYGSFTSSDLTDIVGSLAEGTYIIHFWYTATIENLTVYDSNDGADYKVTIKRTTTGTPYIAEIHTNIYTNNSELIATFADAQQVNVYDLNGKTIDSQVAVNQYRKTLPQGIYIVKVGSETTKVIIK